MRNLIKSVIMLLALIMPGTSFAQTAQTWNISSVNLQTVNTSPSPFRFYGGNTMLPTYDNGQRFSGQAFGLGLSTFNFIPEHYWLGAFRAAGSGTAMVNGSISFNSNAVFLHPSNSIRVKARFTAPSTGQYAFTGSFQIANVSTASGVQVIYNSQTVTLTNPSQSQSFSFNRTLNAGQFVEFEVESMGNPSNDGTNLFLTVSYTPPPAEWQVGTWSNWSSQCSSTSTRTRSVICIQNSIQVAESNCTATKPATTETQEITSSCTYEANYEPLAEWTECANSTQTRQEEVTCVRSDNTDVALSFCSVGGTELSKEITASQACLNKALWAAGDWSPWSTQCGSATRTRDIFCQRDGTTVPEDQCSDPRPADQETNDIFSGCSYTLRNTSETPWSTCQNSQQTRTVTRVCDRSDGTQVSLSFCGQDPSATTATETQSCLNPAIWTAGDWQPWSTQCGLATRNRNVACQRDGSPAPDNQCTGQKPAETESSEIYTDCSYSLITIGQTEWSTCVSGQQTRLVTQKCQRSDGLDVELTFCGTDQNISQQTQECDDPNNGGSTGSSGGSENGGSTGGSSGGNSSSSGGSTGGITNPPVQPGDVIVFRRKLPGTN